MFRPTSETEQVATVSALVSVHVTKDAIRIQQNVGDFLAERILLEDKDIPVLIEVLQEALKLKA